MSDRVNLNSLRAGIHTSTTDWTSTPGSLTFHRPLNSPIFDPGYTAIERADQRADGATTPALRGPKNVSLPDITVELTGLSGGGAGDSTDASTLGHAVSDFLTSVMGQVASNATGETTDGSDAGSGTTVTADASTSFTDGDGILVKGTTSGKYVAREVTGASTADITIDRALTTDDGTADTADEGEVIYAARTYAPAMTTGDHVPFYLDAEGENFRRVFTGCHASASLTLGAGGMAQLNLSGIMATDWTDSPEANPTYADPTTGSPIVLVDCPMWIGSALYYGSVNSIDFGVTYEPRVAQGGPAGHWGMVATAKKAPTFTGEINFGALDGEATDALLATWRGTYEHSAPTFDVGIQMGRQPGSAAYFRAPAARFTSINLAARGGQVVAQFTATCTGTDPARLHVF
jgi:hypothetical protein